MSESVHLCDYPEVDEALVDAELSADMEALLRLVTLGSAARNSVKIKVRQPLAELKIQPASDAERRAIARFADQLREELNIKKVTVHDGAGGSLLTASVKANMKTLGPKMGARLQEVKTAIEQIPAAELANKTKGGAALELALKDEPVVIDSGDFSVTCAAGDGWAAAVDRETQAALDTHITEGLELEGLSREIIRYVQDARKNAKLQMEDRIVLHLETQSPKLLAAITAHLDTIAAETLVAEWADQPPEGAFVSEVKIDGQPLSIALKKR
jgi:isoleucyl-tRNA synthetase